MSPHADVPALNPAASDTTAAVATKPGAGAPGRCSRLSRRDFIAASAVAAAGATLAGGCASPGRRYEGAMIAAPKGSPQRIRVGVIGCGGRGRGAAWDCIRSAPNIEVVAMGDLFDDKLSDARTWLADTAGKDGKAETVRVTDETCFTGFDAYQGVLGCDIDLVILATPPHFRPQHLQAAVAAGKHVFMEKPVAVDPVGVRSVIGSSDLAASRGLAIVCGTQRRHQPNYLEAMRRIGDGAIGDVVAAQCYWNQGELWVKKQEPEWSDMEWQCRNWLYFCWLSGDHIVEQHVHNLDVVNWAMGGPPARCVGMGGRQVRVEPEYGNIYDHFSVEYEYEGGARSLSMCRQIKGTSPRVSERIVGSRGDCRLDGNGNAEIVVNGKTIWKYEIPESGAIDPYQQEHTDLVNSIRAGRPLNEGRRIAESTLTAIMGRMSAYTGRELQWSWVMNASKLDLTPTAYAFGELEVGEVPMPGKTALV